MEVSVSLSCLFVHDPLYQTVVVCCNPIFRHSSSCMNHPTKFPLVWGSLRLTPITFKLLAFSYVLYLVSLCLGTPPVIKVHPMDAAIQLQSNLSLYSVVLYNWVRQNDVIPSDSTGVNTNNLTLINLQPEDAGNY